MVIETNIDDMNSEIYSYIIPKLLNKGALDVYLTNILMKKSRPAVKLSVLVNDEKKNDVIEQIFKETTTFGIRMYKVERDILNRNFKEVNTKYGNVRVKEGVRNGDVLKTSVEYESAKRVAEENDIAIREVYDEVNKNI